MARVVQGIVTKHNLMKQSMVVINKAGGAGGEGFLDVKGSKDNPHKLVITLSNLFTTPLGTGIPFNWKDLTPVAMMALDEFVLWVNAETPYKTAQEYIEAVKKAPPGTFKMAVINLLRSRVCPGVRLANTAAIAACTAAVAPASV